MSRYGSLGRRRSSGAAWLWVVSGVIIGFMCSAVVFVGALAFGAIVIDPAAIAAAQSTQTPWIITNTPPPVTPTNTATTAPLASPTVETPLIVVAPTASPTLNPTLQTLAPTATTSGVGAQSASPGGQTTAPNQAVGGGGIAQPLLALASETVAVTGGAFTMGTTAAEVVAAVDACVAGYGGAAGTCQLDWGQDSQPQHSVTVNNFRIETTEVTYAQYVAFLNFLGPGSHRNGCSGQPCARTNIEAADVAEILFDTANYSVVPTLLNYPVANVTWYGANAYCEALGRRLPTEAEWERAARGDTGFIYPWGNDWNADNAATSRSTNARVAVTDYSTVASPYGTLNMAGNMAEWVNDWYGLSYYGQPDATTPNPQGPATGSEKVVRGGAWSNAPFFARTVQRQSWAPNDPQSWIGFRCVEDATTPAGSGAAQGNSGLLPGQTAFTNTPDASSLGVLPTTGAGSEENFNAQPTLPAGPTATLAPG